MSEYEDTEVSTRPNMAHCCFEHRNPCRVPGVPGAFLSTGHTCWGILNGPASGLALAEMIVDGQATCVDLRPFDPARRMH